MQIYCNFNKFTSCTFIEISINLQDAYLLTYQQNCKIIVSRNFVVSIGFNVLENMSYNIA